MQSLVNADHVCSKFVFSTPMLYTNHTLFSLFILVLSTSIICFLGAYCLFSHFFFDQFNYKRLQGCDCFWNWCYQWTGLITCNKWCFKLNVLCVVTFTEHRLLLFYLLYITSPLFQEKIPAWFSKRWCWRNSQWRQLVFGILNALCWAPVILLLVFSFMFLTWSNLHIRKPKYELVFVQTPTR